MAVGGGIAFWLTRSKDGDAATLQTTAISRGDLTESISSTGQLSALEEVTVGSQVSGTVSAVYVDYNSPVKKGELMAVIDPKTLQAQVTSARAALARAQFNYDEALRQLEEGRPLHEKNYLSEKDMRTLEVAVRTSKTQLDSAQSDFDRNNVQLQYAQIKSPIDGIVMQRSVDPGNTVQSAMTVPTMFIVASDLTKMKILATVDETQIPSIKEDMKATFTVSGIADHTFHATVQQIRLKSTTTNNVVTYTVVLHADNPDKLLFPGMTATIDFILSSHADKLLVPSAALRVRIPDALLAETAQPKDGAPTQGYPPQGAPGQFPQGRKPPDGAGPPGGAPPWGANGPGRQARLGGLGGAPGMSGPGQISGVWKVNETGKAYRIPVRILSSDLTNSAVEPLREGDLKDGDQIVTRVIDPKAATQAANTGNQGQNPAMGGMGGMGGFGGGGPPPGGGGGPPP